jgi:threonine/homoserine/homoserine lactone efflux protein
VLTRRRGRWVRMAMAVALLAVGLYVLSERCGTIHGSPKCGPLSWVASVSVVLALMLECVVFSTPPSPWVDEVLVAVVACVIAFVVVAGITWAAGRSSRRPRSG